MVKIGEERKSESWENAKLYYAIFGFNYLSKGRLCATQLLVFETEISFIILSTIERIMFLIWLKL